MSRYLNFRNLWKYMKCSKYSEYLNTLKLSNTWNILISCIRYLLKFNLMWNIINLILIICNNFSKDTKALKLHHVVKLKSEKVIRNREIVWFYSPVKLTLCVLSSGQARLSFWPAQIIKAEENIQKVMFVLHDVPASLKDSSFSR